jgi:Sec-independent protein translocase protein TatA
MLNVGGGELVVVALIALIALGPEQLPSVMRKLGALSAQVRSVTTGLKDEFLSGMDDPAQRERPPRTSFDPDRPVVPRGYAEQRRAEADEPGDGSVNGHADAHRPSEPDQPHRDPDGTP